jgi:hypothetical protein
MILSWPIDDRRVGTQLAAARTALTAGRAVAQAWLALRYVTRAEERDREAPAAAELCAAAWSAAGK